MTSTKWRNIEKNEHFQNKNTIEGFNIFDDTYWNGKDQLVPSNISTDVFEKIRTYLASPAILLDDSIDKVIFACLSAFVKYDVVDCSSNIIKEKPLIDSNLLWLSESFENITEGFTRIKTHKIGGVTLPDQTKIIKTITDLQKIIATYQQNHFTFMEDTDIYYSTRNKVATYYMQELSNYETKHKRFIDISGLFDFNNWFDNQLRIPSIKNKIRLIKLDYNNPTILTYHISIPELTNKINKIYSEYYDKFIIVQTGRKKTKKMNDKSLEQYYKKKNHNITLNDIIIFKDKLAIYYIQQKTIVENNQQNYVFLTTATYKFNPPDIPTILNVTLSKDNNLLLSKKLKSNNWKKSIINLSKWRPKSRKTIVNCSKLSGCNKEKCETDKKNDEKKSNLEKITQLVKTELYNICFIPLIVLIIYNFYYYLFYKDCYSVAPSDPDENDSQIPDFCNSFNELPDLEKIILWGKLGIDATHPAGVINDYLLDLFFKPIKFIYTFFNSFKPRLMEWNESMPHGCFVLLTFIIMPLFLYFKTDLYNIISSILLFEIPSNKYIWFPTTIISLWFILIALQRIAGIGLIQGKLGTPEAGIPRTWWEWIKTFSVNPFTSSAFCIFTILYWVFKGLTTMFIIPFTLWPMFFYMFFIGFFGIWNNSKDGFNKQTEKPSTQIWEEMVDFIYTKLFEKTPDDLKFFEKSSINSGKAFSKIFIPFLTEIIAIIILALGLWQYSGAWPFEKNNSIFKDLNEVQTFLYMTNATIIILIIFWMSTIKKRYYDNIEETFTAKNGIQSNTDNNYPIDPNKTFFNIWKESLEIEDFLPSLKTTGRNSLNVPANFLKYAKGRGMAGLDITSSGVTNIASGIKNIMTNSSKIHPM